MRPRRHVLQVSTFPFLAVLLCAMGSLILLLLVIDRRAKAVARAKAMQAVARMTEEEKQAEARRKAELERRQRELHERLQNEDQDIVTQVRTVAGQADDAARALQEEQVKSGDMQRRSYEVSVYLTQGQEDAKSRQTELAQTTAKTEKSRKELAELTADLVRMERTLADLKALRERERNKYSLVPYRGKRGDGRKPIYVECTNAGLIFHPDHLVISSLGMSARAIRAEVESRIARRQSMASAGAAKDEIPYLLMLVRPAGIDTYYQTMRALEGLKIDFGYEFVEADWVLDFPDQGERAAQPWMAQDKTRSVPPAEKIAASSRLVGVQQRTAERGVAFGSGGPGSESGAPDGNGTQGGATSGTPGGAAPGSATGFPAIGATGQPSTGQRSWAARSPDEKGVGQPGIGLPLASDPGPATGSFPLGSSAAGPDPARGFNAGTPGPATGSGSQAVIGPPSGVVLGGSPGQSGGDSTSGRPNAGPTGSGLSERGGSGGPTRIASGGALVAGLPAQATSGATAPMAAVPSLVPTLPNSGTGAAGAPGDAPGGQWSPASSSAPSGKPAGDNNGTGQQGPAIGVPQVLPGSAQGASTGSQAQPGGTPVNNGSGSPGTAPAPPGQSTAGPSGATEGSEGSGIRPFLQPVPRFPDSPPPPSRPRLSSNRDWIIAIECTADAVIVPPGGQRIALTALAQGTRADNPLLQKVRQMIDRRQGMVRPGDPPYRPIIRFQVKPDGLQTYYLAFPALETLQVPMTRENLRNDEKRK